jgi:hippurate hydrolase
MSVISQVLAGLDSIRPWQEDLYRDVHQHPELSHHEYRTAGLVAGRLAGSGFEVHEGVGGNGVVGVLRHGDGPVVLLRADMDALPVREATGLPYGSVVTAEDDHGVSVPVMHACGHDVHVVALAGRGHAHGRGPGSVARHPGLSVSARRGDRRWCSRHGG